MRVFALSDIHVDHAANMAWLHHLSAVDYTDDVLLLAGDVSDNLDKLQAALSTVQEKFAQVFFVPGNHEVWVRRGPWTDSMDKFWHIMELCAALGVQTQPARLGVTASPSVWILPLFSWYLKPEEGQGSLFVAKAGENPTLEMWADNYYTRWSSLGPEQTVAEAFLQLNVRHVQQQYDAPVISFSHFVPRQELMFRTPAEALPAGAVLKDAHPQFNFSRVAGCLELDAQIRQLGAQIHVYGHQHRNRQRTIDGVLYISHCLGYPVERTRGYLPDMAQGPKLVWESTGSGDRTSL